MPYISDTYHTHNFIYRTPVYGSFQPSSTAVHH
jgi:hypothetical protein